MVGLGLGDAVGVDAGFHHRRLVPDRAGIDVRHRSRASLRFPQWWGLRSGLNSRTWWRFNALMMPIRANIVGLRVSAPRSRPPSPPAIPGLRALSSGL